MNIRNQLREITLENKYPTDFIAICSLVGNRAKQGYFSTQEIYKKGVHQEQMVRDFHNYFVGLGCGVEHGWLNGFPFIEIWWD